MSGVFCGSHRAQHCGRGGPHSNLGPAWLSLTEQSQAQAHKGVFMSTQHGIFLLELGPVPCCYSVTLGEPGEFQKG